MLTDTLYINNISINIFNFLEFKAKINIFFLNTHIFFKNYSFYLLKPCLLTVILKINLKTAFNLYVSFFFIKMNYFDIKLIFNSLAQTRSLAVV